MRKLFCIFIILSITCQIFAHGIQIIFHIHSTATLGSAPVSRFHDDLMYRFSLEQATIFSTKLESSFCIFRTAGLERDIDGFTRGESASFLLNVITQWDRVLHFLDHLRQIYHTTFHGNHIYLFDLYGDETSVYISESGVPLYDIHPYTTMEQNLIRGVATARHSRLHLALDDAFRYALTEISKYQDIHIRAMRRGIDRFAEQATLIHSENIVSDVRFVEIEIYYDAHYELGAFVVKVILEKEF